MFFKRGTASALVVLFCFFLQAESFILRPRPAVRFDLAGTLNNNDNTGSENLFDQLVRAIITALPCALSPSKPMDLSRVLPDPPRWAKATTASGWKKLSKGQDGYHAQDVADDFAKKYLSSSSTYHSEQPVKKAAKLSRLLADLDELELVDSIDEYMGTSSSSL